MTAPNLPYAFAKKHGVVVTKIDEKHAVIAHLETTPITVFSEITRFLQRPVELHSVDYATFQKRLTSCYQSQSSMSDATEGMQDSFNLTQLAGQLPSSEDLLENHDEAPIIRLLNALFSQAIQKKASDIHIETYENKVLIRMRLDGVLQEALDIPREIAPLVISRVKVMAKLDIAEKRIPQDGRIALRIGGNNIDVRVSTLPLITESELYCEF